MFKVKHLITKKKRSQLKKQRAICIWLTGISASGKSTLAVNLEKYLTTKNKHCYVLDGDNLRNGINADLGFEAKDRMQVTRRICEISKLMVEAGLIVIVSCISPFSKEREELKKKFKKNEFYDIHLNTPYKNVLKETQKKLYREAIDNGSLKKTGLIGLYEEPKNPHLRIDTSKKSVKESVKMLVKTIRYI